MQRGLKISKVLIVLPVQIIFSTYGKNIEGRRKAAISSRRKIPGYKETPAKYAPDSELADKIDGKKVNKYDRVQCVTPPPPFICCLAITLIWFLNSHSQ